MTHDIVQSATALPASPVDDRKKRMKAYSTAMSIRMICLILVFFVPGYWKVVFGIGAVVLPYVAVVLANVGAGGSSRPVNPGISQQLAIEQQRQE
ncbi:DUF3099 domain-containing protein [uncultured Amnibacterium sp.]|uniref:DUF3099 domain-containing protein n=1 Tax=uncultured Amnibacterium sp. TaxID=1631851 RepID=UPI0035CB12EE